MRGSKVVLAVLAAEVLAGRRVGVYIEDGAPLLFFDPDTRELLRTRPNPFTPAQIQRLHGLRPAGPPPCPPRCRSAASTNCR